MVDLRSGKYQHQQPAADAGPRNLRERDHGSGDDQQLQCGSRTFLSIGHADLQVIRLTTDCTEDAGLTLLAHPASRIL
jgi:hypothetical protein